MVYAVSDVDALTAFIRARLADEQRDAQAATPGPWRHDPAKHWRKPGTSWFEEAVFSGPADKDATCVAGTGESDDAQSMADARHIARQDPAATLARVAALRALVDDLAGTQDSGDVRTLAIVARAWRDHPDYPTS